MKSHKKPVHAVGNEEETNIPPGFREPGLGLSTWDEKIWRIVCNIDFCRFHFRTLLFPR